MACCLSLIPLLTAHTILIPDSEVKEFIPNPYNLARQSLESRASSLLVSKTFLDSRTTLLEGLGCGKGPGPLCLQMRIIEDGNYYFHTV
jgi:hypothetical protein